MIRAEAMRREHTPPVGVRWHEYADIFEIVKKLTRLAAQQDRKQWIGDGGNHLNVLVPIEWFVKLPLEPKGAP